MALMVFGNKYRLFVFVSSYGHSIAIAQQYFYNKFYFFILIF